MRDFLGSQWYSSSYYDLSIPRIFGSTVGNTHKTPMKVSKKLPDTKHHDNLHVRLHQFQVFLLFSSLLDSAPASNLATSTVKGGHASPIQERYGTMI